MPSPAWRQPEPVTDKGRAHCGRGPVLTLQERLAAWRGAYQLSLRNEAAPGSFSYSDTRAPDTAFSTHRRHV